MMRVQPAPEPADFDEKVRQPGLRAIAELVGDPPMQARSGPKREKIANRPEDIPAAKLPDYWTHALDDLLGSHHRVCAYVCVYIERVTGASSVDPGEELDASVEQRVTSTIDLLRLNDRECRKLREEYAESYWNNDISLRRLREGAPFLARELQRQGCLRREDM